MPNTLLGFDFGLKRIGVAVGQMVTQSATPLTTLKANQGIPNWSEIESLIKEWQPDTLVVGLPYDMNDDYTESTRLADKFSRRLHGRFGLPVETVDEKLSTFEARDRLSRQDQYKSKNHLKVDALAACIILETWMFG